MAAAPSPNAAASGPPAAPRRWSLPAAKYPTAGRPLTGPPDDVARVIRAFGLATVAGDRIVHGSLVVLVDGEGRIAEKRTDLELDSDRLLASLRKLVG